MLVRLVTVANPVMAPDNESEGLFVSNALTEAIEPVRLTTATLMLDTVAEREPVTPSSCVDVFFTRVASPEKDPERVLSVFLVTDALDEMLPDSNLLALPTSSPDRLPAAPESA